MDKIRFLKIYSNNSGLCNQLYSLITTICECIENNINIIVVSDFLKSIHTNDCCPISDIIDIDNLNIFLSKYNIRVIDKKFAHNEGISLDIDFKNIDNWNILEKYKELFINFIKELNFSDHLTNTFHLQNDKYINKYSTINVIHLRIEDDAIEHWSKINNLEYSLFKNILIKKYIEYISKYIIPEDFTFILTSSINNEVIDYLNINNYSFKITDKFFSNERELNAIIDFLTGKLCNNVYIGPGNSTFTQCILKCINNKKTILFNLDNIIEDPIIDDSEEEKDKELSNNSEEKKNKELSNNSEEKKDKKKIYKELPNNFDVTIYKKLNKDLQNMNDDEAMLHYLIYGINEKRVYVYKIPDDFDVKKYKELNIDLQNMNDDEAVSHYLKYGIVERRSYKFKLPNNFNVKKYKELNEDLQNMNNHDAIMHYMIYGKNENRNY